MSIPGSANPLLLASAAEAGAYQIERSVRFNSADSAYLSRTPASAGNRKTWTWAGWVKLSKLPTSSWGPMLFSCSETINSFIAIYYDGRPYVYHGDTGLYVECNRYLRDFSAWYHICVTYDTTQATASNRIRLYINGSQATFDGGTQPTLDYEATNGINSTLLHHIGKQWSGAGYSTDAYLADIHFIDGQALDPTSFGEFDSNGIWQPIEYTGTYNTNGFHLDFADNSSAAALGYDAAGSNDWTVNNISVTAGTDNDSLVDVPTNGTETDTGVGGEVRGNYATLQPLDLGSINTLENGNLQVTSTTGANWSNGKSCGTIGVTSGKWYWEHTQNSNQYTYTGVGNIKSGTLDNYAGQTANSYGWLSNTTTTYSAGATTSNAPSMPAGGGTVMIALDLDNGKIWWGLNGTWVTSGASPNPATGTDPAYSGLDTTQTWFPLTALYNSMDLTFNFGQRPFAYTAPSGFKALCTTNLPDPTIADGSTAMDVKLYTGNGSTQTISGLGFSPDLVWIKNRAQAYNHKLLDTVRGATEELESNTTDAEVTNADGLTAFNSDGFDLGADVEYNTSTEAYVAWTWDAGSSTVTNTDGSITSQVRANASAGFSIVTYTGNGTAGATVGHGLNVAPEMIIVKNRDQADAWQVYHTANIANPETVYLVLDTPAGIVVALDRWNDTAPGASVFTLGDGVEVNTNTEDYVAYCFTGVSGYSSFGSYTGNGSVINGPFVYTGFRPKWILVKASVLNNSWQIYDSARNVYNLTDNELCPDRSDVENGPEVNGGLDFLSNGFKVKSVDSWLNTTSTYIYAAFAENPFKTARAR